MARPINASINFASDAGYTFDADAVEFVAGAAQALPDFVRTTTIVTPAIDTSAWDRLAMVTPFTVEAVGYHHTFLISTDGGDTWLTTDGASFYQVALTDIAVAGMTRARLTNLRIFPELGDSLVFAVCIHKGSTGAAGSISEIDAMYLLPDTAADEAAFPGGEPASDSSLVEDLGILPEQPVSVQFAQPTVEHSTEGNYGAAVAATALVRSSFHAEFICRGAEERDAVVAYILAHQAQASFRWQPPWEDSERTYIFGDHTVQKSAPGVWRVAAPCVEVFP